MTNLCGVCWLKTGSPVCHVSHETMRREKMCLSIEAKEWLELIEKHPEDWTEEAIRSATYRDIPEDEIDCLVKALSALA
tara:strand:+ start:320 stop:556 length:237 start_codon:yes stop_codon:yes gene_type:complete